MSRLNAPKSKKSDFFSIEKSTQKRSNRPLKYAQKPKRHPEFRRFWRNLKSDVLSFKFSRFFDENLSKNWTFWSFSFFEVADLQFQKKTNFFEFCFFGKICCFWSKFWSLFRPKFVPKSTPKSRFHEFALLASRPRISRFWEVGLTTKTHWPFFEFRKRGGLPSRNCASFPFFSNFRKMSRKFLTFFRDILTKIVKKLEKCEFFGVTSVEWRSFVSNTRNSGKKGHFPN